MFICNCNEQHHELLGAESHLLSLVALFMFEEEVDAGLQTTEDAMGKSESDNNGEQKDDSVKEGKKLDSNFPKLATFY